MKIIQFIIFGLLCFAHSAGAQSVAFDKSGIADKDQLREAKRNIAEGDKYFLAGDPALFNLAIPYYRAAQNINSNNAELNLKLGIAYLYSPQKVESLTYLLKARELDQAISPARLNYYLGRAHHLNSHWNEARKHYELQKAATLAMQDYDPDEIEELEKYLVECQNGEALAAKKERVWIDNLGTQINSEFPEYSPLISTDESVIILTSRRPGSVGDLTDGYDNLPFEDLYVSYNRGGNWSPLENMGEVINTKGHDASSGLSHDGKTLFVFQGSRKGGGDILVSYKSAEGWSRPQKLNGNINTPYHESAAALSYDGRSLFFVSDRPGGFGGNDLYISHWDARKRDWGPAENLGGTVNSPYDEDGIYVHPDGETIYFSSKGHNTMGGSDIFLSRREENGWSKPENIGVPVNTPDDDVFFVVAADGRTAYYSSFRDGGEGEKDIYRITFLGPEKLPMLTTENRLLANSAVATQTLSPEPRVKIKTSRMSLLKAQITDEVSGNPVAAVVNLTDNATGKLLATFSSDTETGQCLVSLPAGRDYGIAVTADGYLFHSENFVVPDSAVFKQISRQIALKKIEVGKTIVLRNIFFDYNKSSVRQESMAELERLAGLLNENPTINIQIAGHTDNVGGDSYNLKLSADRAQAVVDHLINAGIDAGRLTSVGYGKDKPVATNDTPEGRQENRRTEFSIVSR